MNSQNKNTGWFGEECAKLASISFGFLFVLLACAMIPLAGIEGDEAFFSWPIYGRYSPNYEITLFHVHIPLMVFPYAGALKTLLYWPILRVFGPNAWTVRLPVVLIGALTIILFFRLVRKMAGAKCALIACLLLASDPSFVLTDTFDWGPVAIEHLLLVSGCLLIASRRPALGSLCFGLALWNKAVFVWAFAGLSAGVIAAYLPEVRNFIGDRRRLVRCGLAFAIGAAPLIVYNLHSPNATARANIHPSFEGFDAKVVSLRNTLDGSDLFGVIAAPNSEGNPKASGGFWRISSALSHIAGRPGRSLFAGGVLLALLSAPLWWRSNVRRPAIFAAAFSVFAFLTMASVRYTGGAHHVVLLYPMPQMLVGVVVTTIRPRWLLAGAAVVLVGANLLVVNQYIVQLETYGPYGLFTDAITPLSDSLSDATGETIFAVDYGIGDSLQLLHRGRLRMEREWVVPQMRINEIQAAVAYRGGYL